MSQLNFPELKNHDWEFSYIGGTPRVQLKTAKDIQALEHLDPKLWAALSCPVNGLGLDAETLKKMDTDGDEFIRIPDVLKTVYWTLKRIKNPQDLTHPNDSLPLAAIQDSTAEGKNLLDCAKQVLTNIGKKDSQSISKADTADITKIFANTRFNGDSIITEDSADSPEIQSLIHLIVSLGSVMDKSGKPGINATLVESFYASCEAYFHWYQSKKLPFGESTAKAHEAYQVVKNKIEDFFIRCQLTEFDPHANPHLQVSAAQYQELSVKNIFEAVAEIELLPLAFAEPNKKLPLVHGINPAWVEKINAFREQVVYYVFPGKKELSWDEWNQIKSTFAVYENWLSEKKGVEVESLGIEIIEKVVSNNQKSTLLELIAKDKEFEEESNAVDELDTLVRYYCELPILLRNFVNFDDFYNPEVPAIFQAGSLYIDGRCCDLCLIVQDQGRQDLMASTGNVCLLYCECYSKSRDRKMTIVAAMTDGSLDNITVGRNAVFIDRNGEDWGATVVKIIEHPVSIREAFWSPYKKVSNFISSQIEKLASSRSQEMEAMATGSVEKTTGKIETGLKESLTPPKEVKVEAKAAEAKPIPFDIGKFVGIFAAISLALGAIGSVIMNFLTGFFMLKWWQMPIALTGLILTISLPSMVLAYLKIRKRNLAPVLDANGWAINSSIKINILFGQTLTHIAKLPTNARINLNDPFTKRKSLALPILLIMCVVAVVLAFYAVKNGWIPKMDLFKPAK